MENRNTATGFTGTKKWLLVLGTLFITIASQAANYGNNLALPFKLAQLQLDNLYSLYATLPGMGMMISLPLVGTLSTKFGQKRVALGGIVLHWIVRLVAGLSGNTVLFTLSWLLMGSHQDFIFLRPMSLWLLWLLRQSVPNFMAILQQHPQLER